MMIQRMELIVLLMLFTPMVILSGGFKFNVDEFVEASKSIQRPECRILVHDNIRGFLNWHQEWFKAAALAYNIKIVDIVEDNKKLNGKFDVVLFHAPTHKSLITGKLRGQFSKAVFAMLTMEQPNYAPTLKKLDYLGKNVDLMVTYSLASVYPGTSIPNLPITYYPSHIVTTEAVRKDPKPFIKKNGYGTNVPIAVFTSNCQLAGAKERYNYLQELMSLVEVHSYGKCFNNRQEPADLPDSPEWPPIAQRRARKIQVLSNYKFYLAFENSPIDDYVSEKVFEGLFAGTLPIYRGASGIHRFMPGNDSFIDANKMNPKQLAAIVKELSQNEEEYNKYFAFKQRPIAQHFQDITDMSYVHPNVVKRLCDYAFKQQNI